MRRFFEGVAVDKNGNVLAINAFNNPNPDINVYSPPNWNMTNQFGEDGGAFGAGLMFNRTESRVFLADLSGNAGGTVFEFSYPAGRHVSNITAGISRPTGVAVYPVDP